MTELTYQLLMDEYHYNYAEFGYNYEDDDLTLIIFE